MTPTIDGERDQWNIAPPKVARDPNVTMGLILEHTITGYPDECEVSLYNFDCDSILADEDGLSVTAKSYSSNPNIFIYNLLVDTEKVRNSSFTTFEDGFTVGNIRFCTHVESIYNNIPVSFIDSKLTLEFDLANNTFTDGVSTEIPKASLTLSGSLTLDGIAAPTSISNSEFNYASIFEQVVLESLQDSLSTFPNGAEIVIDIEDINGLGIPSLKLLNSNSLVINFGTIILLPCGIKTSCIKAINELLPNMLSSASKDLQQACTTGALLQSIKATAASEGLDEFQNVVVDEDDLVFATDESGNLIFTSTENNFLPIEIDFDVFTSSSLSVCQCDDANLECYDSPPALTQFSPVHICLYPKPGFIITNFGITLTGSNGYEYIPVSLGPTSYISTEFTTVKDVEVLNTIWVQTRLFSNFFTLNEGSDYVIASVTAFAQTSQTKHTNDEEIHTLEFQIPLQRIENLEEENGLAEIFSCIQNFLRLMCS